MIRILLSTRLGERRMTQSELARATGIRSQTINDLYHDFAERVSLFNGTTHAGRIKAYVQFCLAMSAWAINCDHDNLHFKSISGYTQQQKHDLMMRVLTKRLGMRGPEFKTARLHLTSAFLTEAESENTAA